MNVYSNDQMFPYLTGYMLGDRRVDATIDSVIQESMASFGDANKQDKKFVIYFVGRSKGLVANKTTINKLAKALGADTDHWVGASVTLYAAPEQKVFKNWVRPLYVDNVVPNGMTLEQVQQEREKIKARAEQLEADRRQKLDKFREEMDDTGLSHDEIMELINNSLYS